MRALTLESGRLRLRTDYPPPQPAEGQALLRMRWAGICGTDLALAEGYKGGFQGVLGHEYVAEVVEAPGHPEWAGRRVVGEINTACGRCERCRRGLLTHCAHRKVLGILDWDGAFADYFLSPIANLHPVPEGLPDRVAVFTEPVAAAFAALRDLPPDAGERVIIFGAGRLGQLITQVFKQAGFDPLLIVRHPQQIAAIAPFGVRTAFEPPQRQEFDVAVDATGHSDALPAVLKSLRPRGVLILKTTSARPTTIDMATVVVNELRLIGSRCGPFPQALAALAAGRIDPTPLISAEYDLAEGPQAFAAARRSGSFKVLLHT